MLNKILFCGDPHGCFANIISAVLKYRPEAIVMLGDYNLEVPLEQYLQAIIGMTKIYWIPGNRDFDSTSEFENLYYSALSYNNIHPKVIEVNGLRITGLGGIVIVYFTSALYTLMLHLLRAALTRSLSSFPGLK
jgi:predicted phosphodiesterase